MGTKLFHLSDILRVSTGRLVSTRHVNGLYDILNFMTGDNLFTHQLPRAADECRPYLLMEMPWLKEVDASAVSGENWQLWLQELIVKYGEWHEVRQIHPEDHAVIDPIEELRQMAPGKEILPIILKEDPGE